VHLNEDYIHTIVQPLRDHIRTKYLPLFYCQTLTERLWNTTYHDCLLETLVWCSDTPDGVAKHQPRSREIRNTKNALSEH